MTGVQNMKKVVEQLKREAAIKRLLVSQAATSLREYCVEHRDKDMLLTGIPPNGENHYKDKGKCDIL